MYSFTRATVEDLPAVLALLEPLGRQHVEYDPARFVMTPDVGKVYAKWLSENHEGGGVLCLLARDGSGESMGYVLAEAMPADAKYFTAAHAYVHDIYVVPRARGTGLAENLLREVRIWAKARGLTQFRALIATANGQSLAFFRKHGFRPTATEVSQELE